MIYETLYGPLEIPGGTTLRINGLVLLAIYALHTVMDRHITNQYAQNKTERRKKISKN